MTRKHKNSRRQGRETAVQVLFGTLFSPLDQHTHTELTLEHFISIGHFEDQKANSFARELITGVLEHAGEIDRCIRNYSKNWRLERIAKVELTVLRVAVYEMLHQSDVPLKVAINEGIELSKTFGDPKSGRFVNGILDVIARERPLSADPSPTSKKESA